MPVINYMDDYRKANSYLPYMIWFAINASIDEVRREKHRSLEVKSHIAHTGLYFCYCFLPIPCVCNVRPDPRLLLDNHAQDE